MPRLKQALLIFIAINFFLYFYMWNFHSLVPFNELMYKNSAHHYFQDERILGRFNFLRALGQWDAQWYLRIADAGYPENPSIIDINDKSVLDGLTYAFFPLYPSLLSLINTLVGNIEATAFIVSQILMLSNFISLYYVIGKFYGEKIALKTVFLLFLFPFSIFYRSYYTEGLFLLILIWYCYFLIKRKWLQISLYSGLLYVTRPTGLFLFPLTLLFLLSDLKEKKLKPVNAVIFIPVMLGFFGLWLLLNLINTGNMLYWKDVQNSWIPIVSVIDNIKHNLRLVRLFFVLPLHNVHASKIDILIFVYAGLILYHGKKFLKKELWWVSFLMWIIPVLIRDTTAFSRYQIVSFPLFTYLASTLKKPWFEVTAAVFYSVLLFFSLLFINWYWLG